MKYSPKYFYNDMPEWKRKKDQITARFIYRPISYIFSSLCANLKINANTVSYFSMFVAIISACLFYFNNYALAIVGAALVNFWLVLDCVDGNLARSYKKQPFGEFADGLSSYVLVALLCFSLSYYVYCFGGLFVTINSTYILIVGFCASISDTLMRLAYQKYNSVLKDMIKIGVVKEEIDSRNDHTKVRSLMSFIENELGIGGVLPLVLLFSVIFNFVDIFVFYCFVYYCGSCVFVVLKLIYKSSKYRKITMEKRISENDEIQ